MSGNITRRGKNSWRLKFDVGRDGEAGKRQVKGNPRKGVAQAWGDLMQVGTVVVMGK